MTLFKEVLQKSSHNAFGQNEGLYDQMLYWRIRSLEIDLHVTSANNNSIQQPGDWYVFHAFGDPPGEIEQSFESSVRRLSNVMEIFRGIDRILPEHEVITVYLDMHD